jgi:transposase
MKNRYLKGAHLSERKVRELIKLFSEDLTATQIANITGISRITVNAYFKLIRTHIAKFCEERNPFHFTNGTLTYHGSENGIASNGAASKKSFYGIFKNDDSIHTDKIANIDAEWMYDWLKGKTEGERDIIEKYRLHVYNGIADFNSIRLYRINEPVAGLISRERSSKSHIDEIDIFWGMLKSRLIKFRGLNSGTLYLHVKETEFRYNYRDSDLFEMLMEILHKRPLHYSKAVR